MTTPANTRKKLHHKPNAHLHSIRLYNSRNLMTLARGHNMPRLNMLEHPCILKFPEDVVFFAVVVAILDRPRVIVHRWEGQRVGEDAWQRTSGPKPT